MEGIGLFGVSDQWSGNHRTDLVRIHALRWCESAAIGFKVTAGSFSNL